MNSQPFIYRGKEKKYLYDHVCFCCQETFQITMTRKIYYCPTCTKNKKNVYAADQVKRHVKRAVKLGLPATLTVPQWFSTLDDFSWQCAYCRVKPYDVLEHYIPERLAGGTTSNNVLPACYSCNCLKSEQHPALALPEEILGPIKSYLETKKEKGVEA